MAPAEDNSSRSNIIKEQKNSKFYIYVKCYSEETFHLMRQNERKKNKNWFG